MTPGVGLNKSLICPSNSSTSTISACIHLGHYYIATAYLKFRRSKEVSLQDLAGQASGLPQLHPPHSQWSETEAFPSISHETGSGHPFPRHSLKSQWGAVGPERILLPGLLPKLPSIPGGRHHWMRIPLLLTKGFPVKASGIWQNISFHLLPSTLSTPTSFLIS